MLNRTAILSALLCAAVAARAEDNTTVVISSATSNAPGGVIVGYAGTNNTLTVQNAGFLTTTNFSAMGVLTGACANAATVTGAGSTWSSGAGFYVGGYGSFNRLTIAAGGRMIVSNTAFMAMDAASSNNSMLITGSGSAFTVPASREFDIGYVGPGNSVTISNGGSLAAGQVSVGWADTASGNSLLVCGGTVGANYVYVGDEGGDNNRILLTGEASILYASNTFLCGASGRAGRTEVLDGARLESGYGRIGLEPGSDSNAVIVSGSTWSNHNDLYLGFQGSYNTLILTNGGRVHTRTWTAIAGDSNSAGNTAIVTGPGSAWVTTNEFRVGQNGSFNRLEIRDGASVSNGGSAHVGDSATAHGNEVLAAGANTRWVIRNTFRVGEYSGGNRMDLRDGAFLSNSNAYIGSGFSGFSGNVVCVSGPGTVWTNAGEVDLNGGGNALTLSNGAIGHSLELTANGGGTSGGILLDGTNTFWLCAGRAGAGLYGSDASLTIANGARLASGNGMIGLGTVESNTIVVTGAGSVWSNSGPLCAGYDGVDNTLIVEEGGNVFSGDASVGGYTDGDRNLARVSGSNSAWLSRGSLLVGDSDFNRLLVENGGAFACTSAVVGWGTSNEVVVTGAGSSWSNSGGLWIGRGTSGNGNTLLVNSGACAWSRSAVLGESLGEANAAIVTGGGSVWTSAGWITIGQTGRHNRLLVEDGGVVYCRTGFIGVAASSSGNTARVAGTGSLWSVATRLYVGLGGVSSRLEIADGGSVNADRGYIGLTNAGGCEAVVDGGQLVLTNFLEVGDGASGCRLTITNGGLVQDGYAVLGYYGRSSNNEAVVSGPGSTWSNGTTLAIGRLGSNNSLRIERGGAVYAETVELSANGGGANRLVVTDPGSLLVCTGTLHTFYGSGNSILISNGAGVRTTGGGSLGFNAGADSNTMTVAGSGTRFVSADNYMIGWQSSDNRFEVRDGAYVELATPSEIGSRGSRNLAVADGAGTVWTNRADLSLGSTFSNYFGNRLVVTNGATVYVDGHLRIGRWWDRGSNNVAAVHAGSTLIVRSNLWVISGTNELLGGTIRAGALVMTNANGRAAFDSGTLVLDAAQVSNGTPFRVGNGADTAALVLGGGTYSFADGLVVATNASLAGAGTVAAALDNFGAVSPGASPGWLTVSGDVVQHASGSLHIELGGRDAGVTYDQLAVSGSFAADGSLNVTRLRGFIPTNSDVFVIASAASLSGCFATTNLPLWFSWTLQYVADSVVLAVTGVETATNGVPKAWLADHGWTNDFDAAATNDPDHDRVATWEEYYAGTDPTNGASFFQCLDISRANFPMIGKIVRWNAVSGRVYAVDAATSLQAPAWSELARDLVAPLNSWTDTTGAAGGHYRVRVQP